MSHSQFHSTNLFILRHAWLSLWEKHMTTGRINQVTTFHVEKHYSSVTFMLSGVFVRHQVSHLKSSARAITAVRIVTWWSFQTLVSHIPNESVHVTLWAQNVHFQWRLFDHQRWQRIFKWLVAIKYNHRQAIHILLTSQMQVTQGQHLTWMISTESSLTHQICSFQSSTPW